MSLLCLPSQDAGAPRSEVGGREGLHLSVCRPACLQNVPEIVYSLAVPVDRFHEALVKMAALQRLKRLLAERQLEETHSRMLRTGRSAVKRRRRDNEVAVVRALLETGVLAAQPLHTVHKVPDDEAGGVRRRRRRRNHHHVTVSILPHATAEFVEFREQLVR